MSKTSTGGADAAESFTVKIAWAGPEDKPLPSVLLVSGSHEEADGENSTVISEEEFRRLTAEVRAVGRDCAKGPYVSDEPQYYVQIEEGGEVWSCGLSFGPRAVEALKRIAGALDEHNRRALMDVVEAIARFEGGAE